MLANIYSTQTRTITHFDGVCLKWVCCGKRVDNERSGWFVIGVYWNVATMQWCCSWWGWMYPWIGWAWTQFPTYYNLSSLPLASLCVFMCVCIYTRVALTPNDVLRIDDDDDINAPCRPTPRRVDPTTLTNNSIYINSRTEHGVLYWSHVPSHKRLKYKRARACKSALREQQFN